jgi:phage FluMu protein Com
MNLRCSFCQTPFTIGRFEKLDALQHMDANNLTHYDAHCPRCRRATPVLRQKLEMTFPNWRDALKELEAELKAHPQPEAPLPKLEPDAVAEIESKPEHRARAGKAVKVEEKPMAKAKPAARATASKTSSSKGKAASKKSK